MYEVRVHGRGGQGVVTAAELFALAASLEGHEAQAFPSFGSERMGAPVVAFCRLDTRPIRLREPIAEPDAVLVMDPTLLHHVDVFGGLRAGGLALINTSRTIDALGLAELHERQGSECVLTVPASELARRRTGRPIPNAAILGALCAATGRVSIDALGRAIDERLRAGTAAANRLAAVDAYEHVRARVPEPERAAQAEAEPEAARA